MRNSMIDGEKEKGVLDRGSIEERRVEFESRMMMMMKTMMMMMRTMMMMMMITLVRTIIRSWSV